MSLIQINLMLGFVYYLLLEQVCGFKVIVQSDIYVMGIIFYEMLIGYIFYDGDSVVIIVFQYFQKFLLLVIVENLFVFQVLENVVIKVIVKKLIDCYKLVVEMYVDLLSSLFYNCCNELKLVFDDVIKVDIKIFFKVL